MKDLTVVAIDLGGSNARVASVTFSERSTTVRIHSRLHHRPVGTPGAQTWNWDAILASTRAGLSLAMADRPASLSIDAWGLDYGLLMEDGSVRPPFAYRANRGVSVFDAWSADDRAALVSRTRTRISPITTVFQLLSETDSLRRARAVLPIPSLLQYELTGRTSSDPSIASTTGLSNPATGRWDDDLIAMLGLPARSFPEILEAGESVGSYHGVPLLVSYGHDTAAAINASVVGQNDIAAVLGTWLIIGAQLEDLPGAVHDTLGVEHGNDGLLHLLTAQHGMWILDQLGAHSGTDAPRLLRRPATNVDLTDESLLAPTDMAAALRQLTGLPGASTVDDLRSAVVYGFAAAIDRGVCDIAGATASATDHEVVLVGGGAANPALGPTVLRLIDASSRFGPREPAVLGNAMRQAVALGHFGDIRSAARHLARHPLHVIE